MKMTKRQRLARRRQAYRLKKKESILNELDIKFNHQAKLSIFDDSLKIRMGRKDKGVTLKTLTKLEKTIKRMPEMSPMYEDSQYYDKLLNKELPGLEAISKINKYRHKQIMDEYRQKIDFLSTLPKYKNVAKWKIKIENPLNRGQLLNKINDKYFYEENKELFQEASRERKLANGNWNLFEGKGAASKKLNAEMFKFKYDTNYVSYKKRKQ